jgi:fructose-bisphosphate aldolase class I
LATQFPPPIANDIEALEAVAARLTAPGKGLLAADETPGTLTKRFEAHGITSSADSRRAYREMLFTAPGAGQFISGVILQDETIRQSSSTGTAFPELLSDQGVIPGIKVDTGAKVLAGSPREYITEGLDGLRDRLAQYRTMGARFAKWRAVIRIEEDLPSPGCILANAQALARYAALCQEQGLVPIVEPEVLMEGGHFIERCEEVTDQVLHAVFGALFEQGVHLEAMLLKPNMVIPGKTSPMQISTGQVASATLRCLRRRAPAAVPGIVFLSGGQDEVQATRNLDAINRLSGAKPWTLSFSYGRALQDSALEAWAGREDRIDDGHEALMRRARCNSAAARGAYREDLERGPSASGGRAADREAPPLGI